MRVIQLLIFIFSCVTAYSQLVQPNETLLFSFKTKSGKSAVLCKGSNDSYLVYRFGTNKSMELEYPSMPDNSSWQKFTYSFYFRGGGKKNAGEDLNYVSFENNGYKYKIYTEYYAEDESVINGIIVTDKEGKETDIRGVNKSVEGTLVDLRFNDLIKKDQ